MIVNKRLLNGDFEFTMMLSMTEENIDDRNFSDDVDDDSESARGKTSKNRG